MDNQTLGLIGIGVVAYLVLKNKEEEKVEPVTPSIPPTPPTPPTPVLPGCMDPTATNYNPAANINDMALCQYPIEIEPVMGCMDPIATNYDPLANIDSNSCTYPVSGCMDQLASNYNPNATSACS